MPCIPFDFAVIGGDMRQVHLSHLLSEKGWNICVFALCQDPDSSACYTASSLEEAISLSKTIIAPLPMTRNGKDVNHQTDRTGITLPCLLDNMESRQRLFAGGIPTLFHEKAALKNIPVIDFMKDKNLQSLNCLATAEGAAAEAFMKSPKLLAGSSCLVLGYGKCGKALATYLKNLSCIVTVCARKESIQKSASQLADQSISFEELESLAGTFDFIFNTVPAPVLTKELLEKIKKDTLIIDIASAPGGTDFSAAREMGLSAYLCPGLPGKYASYTLARAMLQIIIHYVSF